MRQLRFVGIANRLTLFQAADAEHSLDTDMWCGDKEALKPSTGMFV